jgi:hypothetical protein
MIGVLIFNAVMVLLCAAIAFDLLPGNLFNYLIEFLHNTIGISTPPPKAVRIAALIWLVSMIIIVDGLLYLLVYVF